MFIMLSCSQRALILVLEYVGNFGARLPPGCSRYGVRLPWLCLCCILYMLICMQMVINTRLIQSIRVLSEHDYISVSCYSVCATTSIFSFSWVVWWPLCIFISSWLNFDGLTANLVLFHSIIYVQLSSNGTESTSGHWALCCLWVIVMFISSIRVNLYIRPCILVCAFL